MVMVVNRQGYRPFRQNIGVMLFLYLFVYLFVMYDYTCISHVVVAIFIDAVNIVVVTVVVVLSLQTVTYCHCILILAERVNTYDEIHHAKINVNLCVCAVKSGYSIGAAALAMDVWFLQISEPQPAHVNPSLRR